MPIERPVNIVVPMAGRGSRFQDAGYKLPKPLIPVHGIPMIQLVVDNIRPKREHKFIFLCLQAHLQDSSLKERLHTWAPGCEIISVNAVTEGPACTVLLAEKFIDNALPLMMANCDQWIDVDIDDYLDSLDREHADGLIMTMKADHPKWSYARMGARGNVVEVVEKVVVSNEATVGIYNYRTGSRFCNAARNMIAKDIRVNGEFYVGPVYNEVISEGGKVVVYNIGEVGNGMYGLGTPEDLSEFLAMEISQGAGQKHLKFHGPNPS